MLRALASVALLLVHECGGLVAPVVAPRRGGLVARPAAAPAEVFESLSMLSTCASKCVVVKYGGHAMTDAAAADAFARDIVLMQKLGVKPVVVHGGGPQIGKMLARLDTTSTFVDGLRVTDAATLEISEMVLCGSINKQIASAICRAGGHAMGLSGKDDNIVVATKKTLEKKDAATGETIQVDLGFVGEPESVNVAALRALIAAGLIPVIAPIATGAKGETLSVNADTAAGAIAGALGAERLLLLTDVAGVLDKEKELILTLTPSGARALITDGTISAGMIPKIENAIQAVEAGCAGAAIVDGRVEHAVIRELTSASSGTLVTAE